MLLKQLINILGMNCLFSVSYAPSSDSDCPPVFLSGSGWCSSPVRVLRVSTD